MKVISETRRGIIFDIYVFITCLSLNRLSLVLDIAKKSLKIPKS
jgi:hypothetical protein